jgi:aryl-alcohol dehydrogenase-like predicted oxidoreductase
MSTNRTDPESVERELIRIAKALKLGLTAWSPLTKGVLPGRTGQSSENRFVFCV